MPSPFTLKIVRPDDLLVLELELINLHLLQGPPRLERLDPAQPALIVVHFPSQHIAEEAFFEAAGQSAELPEEPPVDARMAGPSRLAFKVPEDVSSIPYTLESLLAACRTYELAVASNAQPPPPVKQVNPRLPPPALPGPQGFVLARRAQLRERIRQRTGALPKPGGGVTISQAPLGVTAIPHEPAASETAIEAPFRLFLSPNALGAWAHALRPVVSPTTGRVELWHTRLGVRAGEGEVDEHSPEPRTVRAIWSRDPGFSGKKALPLPLSYAEEPGTERNPFRMPLDARDRHQIVHLTSNFNLSHPGHPPVPYVPEPLAVERLMLTSLGAWLDIRGTWEKRPKGLDLVGWQHDATLGRDHFVRTVTAYFLFPFRHPAHLVTVTERKFDPDHPGRVAWLRQRQFIEFPEPVRTYGGRQMPFKSVRVLTRVTPPLEEAADHPVLDTDDKGDKAFWPYLGDDPFAFHLRAVDEEDNVIELTAPLILVRADIEDEQLQEVIKVYNESPLRIRPLAGQKVIYAPGDGADNTRFETTSVNLGARLLPAAEPPPRFVPVIEEAAVRIPAIQSLVGGMDTVNVRFHETYLLEDFGGTDNPGDVFLELLQPTGLSFDNAGDKSGGLVKPNMKVSGLSRRLGPVAGDLGKAAKGVFEPEKFFAELCAKVFGVIDLWDIIDGPLSGLGGMPKFVTQGLDVIERLQQDLTTLAALVQSSGLPQQKQQDKGIPELAKEFSGLLSDPTKLDGFLTQLHDALDLLPPPNTPAGLRREFDKTLRQIREVIQQASPLEDLLEKAAKALELPRDSQTRFEWKPTLKSWPDQDPIFVPHKPDGLRIGVEVKTKSADLAHPSFDAVACLEKFDIRLIATVETFLVLHFDRLMFIVEDGKKPEVDVVLDEVEFAGPLSFVETLKNLIPVDGFSDPPALDVTARGITASFSASLPDVAVGIFSLQNLSLGAAFDLPFIGDPLSLRFNFCERDNPFLLTVSCLGGGGFFGITLTPKGVQLLEAALEFGASLSVDFGVASGGVSIMAGIYFKMEESNVSLTGYLRIRGEVSVLGLISCGIELYMDLTYSSGTGKVIGRATLLIEVEVLFFSTTVELSCERKFAGSNGDPTFRDVMTDPGAPSYLPWNDYCQAFAA